MEKKMKIRTETEGVLETVRLERMRQDQKWDGAKHDDKHTVFDFIRWIKNYAGWASQMADMNSFPRTRKRLIQIAALAVAAVESMDRKAVEKITKDMD